MDDNLELHESTDYLEKLILDIINISDYKDFKYKNQLVIDLMLIVKEFYGDITDDNIKKNFSQVKIGLYNFITNKTEMDRYCNYILIESTEEKESGSFIIPEDKKNNNE